MNWSPGQTYSVVTACRICGGDLEVGLDLGMIHVNAFPGPNDPDTPKTPLRVAACKDCGAVQLDTTTNPALLYTKYHYRSGTNLSMRRALAEVAAAVQARKPLLRGDVVVDTGSNDGTLLTSYTTPDLVRVGFEPSNIALEGRVAYPGHVVVKDYFTAEAYPFGRPARVVTSIAMFYGLHDPAAFAGNVDRVLDRDGLWVLQLAYLPDMLRNNAVDGNCQEHLFYYDLRTLQRVLSLKGFRVQDVERVAVNEGSFRVFAYRHDEGPPASPRVELFLRQEEERMPDALAAVRAMADRLRVIRGNLVSYLEAAKARGEVVHGYGASTKGNTLLQFFNLGSYLEAIWERQPQKWGLQTVGTRVPIISEEQGRQRRPDHLLVLPWHFAEEFVQREAAYLEGGGAMVFPLPHFRVVGKDSEDGAP